MSLPTAFNSVTSAVIAMVGDARKTVGEKRHNGPKRLSKCACEATREDSWCETLPLR